jgi:putative two-component system hydrogenase maturation factor HypX/HoxX
MKILLLASAYNSMTQRFHVELTYHCHDVSIELAMSDIVMTEAVELYQPDIIIAPFLKTAIPESIWRNHLCIIIHPGIKGDRGPSSIDWAILNDEPEWGVTALQADAEMDAGNIWSSINFQMNGETKSGLYRGKCAQAAIKAILEILEKFNLNLCGESLDYSRPDVKGCWRDPIKQKDRAIDWDSDTTQTVIRKIRSADSQPGLLDNLFDQAVYLYCAHAENLLTGTPGQIIAQRHGAICRATIDGAVWITHLKKKSQGTQTNFKLPASLVLGELVTDVPEVPVPLELPKGCQTYREIWYEEKNQVGYLHFCFYNGAMSTDPSTGLIRSRVG